MGTPVGHALLFLYLFLLLPGVASIAVSALALARTRERVLVAFLVHGISFTLFVLSYVLALSYTNLNVDEPAYALLVGIIAVALISTGALAYAIPLLTHALVWDEARRIRTVAAAAVALLIVLSAWKSLRFDAATETITQVRGPWIVFSQILFLLVIVYAAVLKLLSLRRLKGEARQVVRNLLGLNLLFLLAFPLDLYLLDRHQLTIALPVLYGGFCVVAALYVGRRYLLAPVGDERGFELSSIATSLADAGISDREQEVMALLVQGLDNRRIAEALFISLNTVKTHNRRIYKKMDVKSRFELVMKLRHLAR